MVQVDPWEKAADCERAKQTAIDPQRKAIFERLRDLWIALGNKRVLMTETQWATGIEALNRLHLEWTLAETLKETALH
jgi:hypothetical protein